MELIINRIKGELSQDDVKFVISSDPNEFAFSFNWGKFSGIFDNDESIIKWESNKEIGNNSTISYEFSHEDDQSNYLYLPFIESFGKKHFSFLLGKYLINNGFIIDFHPIGVSLSGYMKIDNYDANWDIYQRIDFLIHKYNNKYELTFNVVSQGTFIGTKKYSIKEDDKNIRIITPNKRIIRSKFCQSNEDIIIANREIKEKYGLKKENIPIDYRKRYKELLDIFNRLFKGKEFEGVKLISTGFDSIPAHQVRFENNIMIFKDNNKDINPITGMRNNGVFKPAPNSSKIEFLFIFQNNDDANALYKYLKGGYKGFPGLERYVDIPLVLANSSIEEQKYKRLQYGSKETLMDEYSVFEEKELPSSYYEDLFAIVIGPFNKDNPDAVYYKLKTSLLRKGIPSQFIDYQNIRKTSVFNYHLPNIAIGIIAKLGGIPWRIDSEPRNDLIIGFNQAFKHSINGKIKILAGSVFFDNIGYLKRTFSFPERESSTEMIHELRNAVNSYLEEHGEVNRIVIHYHKTLSITEKKRIDKLLKEEFQIPVPYAVVEINDTKSKIELAFDPKYDFTMPVSGTYLRLSRNEYLLFNNNRFKKIAPVRVKDELPLKIRIHFADESGFSHRELLGQVYEFSRLIWKGLKQRSQPATCFYAKEIAQFKAKSDLDIPNNKLTQTTPWVI